MNAFLSSRLVKLVVVGALIVGILAAATPWLLVYLGNKAYAKNDFDSSVSYWRTASYISWYDRDIPLTDYGNALYRKTNYEGAAGQYQKAVPLAPKSRVCPIRINWSLSLIQIGEKVRQTDKRKALSSYSEALRVVSAEDCQDDSATKEQSAKINEQMKELSKREDKPKPAESKPQDTKSVEEKLQDNSQEQEQRNSYNNRRAYEETKNKTTGEYDFAY